MRASRLSNPERIAEVIGDDGRQKLPTEDHGLARHASAVTQWVAPLLTRRSTIAVPLARRANNNGVSPFLFLTLTSAPLSISSSAISSVPPESASESGVKPRASRTLTCA